MGKNTASGICLDCDYMAECVFGDLSEADSRRVIRVARHYRFDANESIWQEGLFYPGCYIICQGTAMLIVRSFDGKHRSISVFGPTGTLYHPIQTRSRQYSAQLRSLVPGYLSFLPIEEFKDLSEIFPSIWGRLTEKMAHHCIQLIHEVGVSSCGSVRCRIARTLHKLLESDVLTERCCTQTLISQVAGVSRESANRTLHSMAEEGVVTFDGHRIDSVDSDQLEAFL